MHIVLFRYQLIVFNTTHVIYNIACNNYNNIKLVVFIKYVYTFIV